MAAAKSGGPTVTTKHGTLLGRTGVNLDGEQFYKFLGIPFAKPPVGPLRFKAPQPPEPWEGVRDCTKDGNPCVGVNFKTREIVGSEDCLYLNVHTRNLPQPGLPLRPVLVYFHGGGFILGSGIEDMCGPQYLMTQDVVFVSINYRLSVFGFLSLEDTSLEVPGNAGLKDQTQALKWVQENIAQFGGDPNNVTIFGVSAGGASVHFQILSPSAKGLFHRAIAQSGSVLNPWAWGQRNALQVAEKLGRNLKEHTEKEALDVLMKAPAEELFKAAQSFTDTVTVPGLRRPFGPVIEKPNPTAFLCEDPAEILLSGRFHQVPLIQGVCSNEGLIREFDKLLQIMSGLATHEHLIPWNLDRRHSSFPNWERAVRSLYYGQGVNDRAEHQHIGDAAFHFGIIEYTKLALRNSEHPIYLYQLSFETDKTKQFRKELQLADDITGVYHGGDANVLVPDRHFFGGSDNLTPRDIAAIRTVVGIWTEFARTGMPHPEWRPVTDPEQFHFFNLAEKLEMLKNPFEERLKVWNKILKEAGGFNFKIDESVQLNQ